MRRFSQRSALVTLSEINITPLLDLAFVLLIIFIITTPLIDRGIPIKLPTGGQPDKAVNKQDVRTVEITPQGTYVMDRHPLALSQVEAQLVNDFRMNPNLIVYIRSDRRTPMEYFFALVDACQRHNITRYSVRGEPPKPQ